MKSLFILIPVLLSADEPKIPVRAPLISETHKKEWYKADAAVSKANLAKSQAELSILQDCGIDYTPVFSNDEMVCQEKPKPSVVPKEKDAKH